MTEKPDEKSCCSQSASVCVCRLVTVFLLTLLLIAAVYYGLYRVSKPSVNNESVTKLLQGMSPDQVQEMVGPPNAKQVIDSLQTWWYYDTDKVDHAAQPSDIAILTITFDRDNKLHELKYMQR